LHLSIFTHFCEAFIGILPHFHLFQHFFILIPIPNAIKPSVVGGCELVLRPETRAEYLVYDPAGKGTEWKKILVSCRELRISTSRKSSWHPQVQENWSSTGPGGKQVECILGAIASWKNKGVTGDHVVFSFVGRRIQPLQHRKHPTFKYEGTKDPTRLSPEAMAHSEAIRRCCKVLDNFDKSLKLPALFWVANPPKKTRVSVEKHYRVLVDKVFNLLMNSCLFC